MRFVRGSLVVAGLAVAVALPPVAEGASKTVLKASLSGKNEREPAGDPNGRGSARITLQSGSGQVCYSITLRKVGTVAAGHIHKGGTHTNGPVSVPLFDKATKQPKGCVSVSKALVKDIAEHPRRYYVNVHNAAYQAGAARGQLHR